MDSGVVDEVVVVQHQREFPAKACQLIEQSGQPKLAIGRGERRRISCASAGSTWARVALR